MKDKNEDISKKASGGFKDKKMTRKEALKKSGFIAISAATTLLLLSNPNKAQAASGAPPPVWPPLGG